MSIFRWESKWGGEFCYLGKHTVGFLGKFDETPKCDHFGNPGKPFFFSMEDCRPYEYRKDSGQRDTLAEAKRAVESYANHWLEEAGLMDMIVERDANDAARARMYAFTVDESLVTDQAGSVDDHVTSGLYGGEEYPCIGALSPEEIARYQAAADAGLMSRAQLIAEMGDA